MCGASKVCTGLPWEGTSRQLGELPSQDGWSGSAEHASTGRTISKLGGECFCCAGSHKCPCI